MTLRPFVYTTHDGLRVVVQATLTYYPSLDFNKHTAASRDDLLDDLLDELIVDDILVIDEQGNDVTEVVHIPNKILLREMELQGEDQSDWDREDLTVKHISDESDWYYGEMYNV